jgi:hypothetical protein
MIFDNFTWQAGATFFAAAVAGTVAAIIGWRQVGIARAAMEVAKAQSLTARLAQRGALFEKRFAAYMTVQSYLNTALHGDAFALIDFNDKMRKLNAEVRFLFPKSVETVVHDAFAKADEYAEIRSTTQHDSSAEGAERSSRLRKQLREIIIALPDVMGEEMKLYSGEGTHLTFPDPGF